MSYNGWKDRETWALNLWWSNDYGMYQSLTEIVQSTVTDHDDGDDIDRTQAITEVEEFLRQDFDEREANISDPMMRDIMGQPDFREVARAWVDEEIEERKRGA